MSLLIKALKQAERRHAEATAAAADREVGVGSSETAGHSDPDGDQSRQIHTPLPPVNELLLTIADSAEPATGKGPEGAAAPIGLVASGGDERGDPVATARPGGLELAPAADPTPQARVSAARAGIEAIAAAKAASEPATVPMRPQAADEAGQRILSTATGQGAGAARATSPPMPVQTAGSGPAADAPGGEAAVQPTRQKLAATAMRPKSRSRLMVMSGLTIAAIGIGAWLAWSLWMPDLRPVTVVTSGVIPVATDPVTGSDDTSAATASGGNPGSADGTARAAADQGDSRPDAAAVRTTPVAREVAAAAHAAAPSAKAAEQIAKGSVAKLPAGASAVAAKPSPTADRAQAPALASAAVRERPPATTAAARATPDAATIAAVAETPGMKMVAPAASRSADPVGGIRLQPGDSQGERIAMLAATAYAALGRQDDAAARAGYEEVIALDRNHADAWIGLATLAARRGDTLSAERLYQRAIEIDPNHVAARAGLLSIRGGADPVSQESQLRSLIAVDPNQPGLHFALGNVLARQARWLDAQQAYFVAFSADPKRPEYAFNLAVSLDQLRQPRPAVDYYRRALALAGTQPAGFPVDRARTRVAALEQSLGLVARGSADAGGEAR